MRFEEKELEYNGIVVVDGFCWGLKAFLKRFTNSRYSTRWAQGHIREKEVKNTVNNNKINVDWG